MRELWKNHRKICVAACVAMALIVFCAYLFAAFRAGMWYKDVFLYRQLDGTFSGEKDGVSYSLRVSSKETDKTVAFSVNGKARTYRVVETIRIPAKAASMWVKNCCSAAWLCRWTAIIC